MQSSKLPRSACVSFFIESPLHLETKNVRVPSFLEDALLQQQTLPVSQLGKQVRVLFSIAVAAY